MNMTPNDIYKQQNAAYRFKDDKNWVPLDRMRQIDRTDKRIICIRYNEGIRGFKAMVQWKLVINYQQEAMLKDMLDKIDGYSHALIVKSHIKKAYHYVTIRLLGEPTSQDLSCLTTPLRFLKDLNGNILLTNDDDPPEPSQVNKFNFHVNNEDLREFLHKAENMTEKDFEERDADKESSIEKRKKSSSKSGVRDEQHKPKIEIKASPLIVGLDDSISAKSFKARKASKACICGNKDDNSLRITVIMEDDTNTTVFNVDNIGENEAVIGDLKAIARKTRMLKLCSEIRKLIPKNKRVKEVFVQQMLRE